MVAYVTNYLGAGKGYLAKCIRRGGTEENKAFQSDNWQNNVKSKPGMIQCMGILNLLLQSNTSFPFQGDRLYS
jgi:hypothetical protein